MKMRQQCRVERVQETVREALVVLTLFCGGWGAKVAVKESAQTVILDYYTNKSV